MVVFLAAPANEEALAQFQRVYSGPEELHASGKELDILLSEWSGALEALAQRARKAAKNGRTRQELKQTAVELQKLVQEAARTFQDGTRATTTGTSAV